MRVVILKGPESFLRLGYTRKLAATLEAAHGEIDRVRFDGASASAADVLDECRSFSLMQRHKLVIVDEADRFVKEDTRPILERYVAGPAEQATLVLRAETWRPGNLDKAVARVGAIVPCEPESRERVREWILGDRARRWGVTVEEPAADLLLDRLGVDLGRINSELEKLSAAAGVGGASGAGSSLGPVITLDLVRDLVGTTREDEAWPWQGILLGRDPEAALAALERLVESSRQDPVFLSYVEADLARKLHTTARLLAAGANPGQAAAKAKIWGEARDAILSAARRSDPEALADLLDDAVEADSRMKSGLADPRRSVEALAVRFASI